MLDTTRNNNTNSVIKINGINTAYVNTTVSNTGNATLSLNITDVNTFFSTDEASSNVIDIVNALFTSSKAMIPKNDPKDTTTPVDTTPVDTTTTDTTTPVDTTTTTDKNNEVSDSTKTSE
jgi:hypothetical protein